MRVDQNRIANTAPIAVIIGASLLGFYLVQQISVGKEQWAIVSVAAIGAGLAVLRPRLGLYAIVITLLFTDSGSANYVGGYRFTSPSTLLAAGTLVGWGAMVTLRGSRVTGSALYVPFAIVALALWIARFRYHIDFPIAYVTTQALVLGFLTHQLIRNTSHLRMFLVMLALVLLVRNTLDIGLTVRAILNGEYLGPIRFENLPLSSGGGSSTTGSDLRSLLLPLFIAAAMLAPSRKHRLLFLLTLISGVAWVSLSAARGGILGLALGTVVALAVLPRAKRKDLLLLMPIGLVVVIRLAVRLRQ